MTTPSYLEVFRDRRITVILFLGFSSGLPVALSGGTLQAWFADSDVDIKTIGLLTLVGLPYTVKFLWAPLMDRFVPPLLGRRRGWVAISQLAVCGVLLAMGATSPSQSVYALALLALLLAFVSASQDIAFDAYRTDVLDERRRGAGAAVSVLGYRLAMLTSGALALILADRFGWHWTYSAMAALMLAALAATLAAPEPGHHAPPPRSLFDAVVHPFVEYFRREQAAALLALVVLYKLGDAFAVSLSTTFLLRGVGLSLSGIGVINKGLALASTILGALLGGALLARLRLFRALLLFGALQAISNLAYAALALAGKNYFLVVAAVGLDNLAGGMGTAAFVALLMSLCDPRYTATQFALLSAAAAVGRVFVGPPSGWMVASMGWAPFFAATFLIALPGLALLWWLRAALPGEAAQRA